MAKKLSYADLQNLPESAKDFITLVIKKMRYRKKVRDEVMAELIAHFEDELQSCATDEEKEQKAKKLIADFGDVKLLAVLLRRAKKRCRPLWRKALIRSFQALGIIVLYILICFGRLGIGTPDISVNYIDWLNELVRADRDETKNARAYYDRAAELYVECPIEIKKKSGIASSRLAEFNNLEMKHLLNWLADNQPAFEMLRQGVGRPYFWPTYSRDSSELIQDTTLPSALRETAAYMQAVVMQNVMKKLPDYRKLGHAMTWEIQRDVYNGDTDDALDDCIVLQQFGGHLQGKGLLVEQLVGIAIEALANKKVFMVLKKADVPANALKKLQEELEKVYGGQEAVINMEAEKAFWYDLVQRGFTDDGKGSGRVLKWGLPLVMGDWKDGVWGFVTWSYPDRREVTNTIDKYFQRSKELLDKTPWELHKKGLESEGWDEIVKDCFMLKILGPALSRVGQIAWRLKTGRAALLTVLAILRYRQDTGDYQENLEELITAGYLKKIPLDLFSDKPLVYKRTDDDFILYSVGYDFEDDGGEVYRDDKGRVRPWADEGDWVFWPVRK